MNAHGADDLRQMQSLPLEAKIRMTKERIEAWHDNWTRFEIYDKATGKTRFTTIDTRDVFAEPKMKEIELIQSAFPGQVYVSFSGGKDSTVLKHIIDSMYDDVPAVFVNTGLEYPEIQQFVREVKAGKYGCFNPDVEILRPEMRFDEVIKIYGYPVASKELSRKIQYAKQGRPWAMKYIDGTAVDKEGRPSRYAVSKRWMKLLDAPFEVSAYCCEVMKKRPVSKYGKETGRKPIVGTLACESRIREQAWMRTGCNAFDNKKQKSQPMAFWTENDVLQYIVEKDLPYASVYGEIKQGENGKYYTTGADRTGCMFCMFGCHLEKEPNRFQRMKVTHPTQYKYCMDKLGLKEVLDYIGVPHD